MTHLWIAGAGLLLAVPLTGLARRWGQGRGLTDAPAPHKSHDALVARSGGIGVGAALGLTLAGMAACGLRLEGLLPYVLPALGFLALGVADDRWRLGAGLKLAGQLVLAVGAVLLGLRWEGDGLGPLGALELGALTAPLTALWILAVVTVVNFLDGIDLITAATTGPLLALAAGAGAGPGQGALYAAAAGAVLGFAAWNVPRARVFIGDGGTHLLGFLVASSALVPRAGVPHALPWPLAGAVLLPGIVDVAAGLVTKWRRGVRLAAAHRDHPYQRLTRLGCSHTSVALRYGALVLLAALTVRSARSPLELLGGGALGVLLLGGNLRQAARAPRAPPTFFR